MKVNIKGFLGTFLLLFPLVVLTANCGRHSADLPRDFLGISIGMEKAAAEQRLSEIAVFQNDARKRQQLWRLKDMSRFESVAVGYDQQGVVRFITAFANPANKGERLRFQDVGDLSKAKAEIVEPHFRYIWEVPAENEKIGYMINVYGDNPEFVTNYSLVALTPTADSNTVGSK